MTKRQLAINVSEQTNITQQAVLKVLEAVFANIKSELANGGHVEFRNFGVWKTCMTKPRVGRNPNKPEVSVTIPARQVVRFRMSKNWRKPTA